MNSVTLVQSLFVTVPSPSCGGRSVFLCCGSDTGGTVSAGSRIFHRLCFFGLHSFEAELSRSPSAASSETKRHGSDSEDICGLGCKFKSSIGIFVV